MYIDILSINLICAGIIIANRPKGPFPSGKAAIASVEPNKKLELIMQFNPFLKEYISFNLESHSEGTTLSCTRKSYGPFSFMSVWGFDSSKSKILDNLGYLIPQEDFTSSKDKSKEASQEDGDTSDSLFSDRNHMAAYLVNKTLDGDSEIIKATKDVYARGKAKALLIKINKGNRKTTMPEAEAEPTPPTTASTTATSANRKPLRIL